MKSKVLRIVTVIACVGYIFLNNVFLKALVHGLEIIEFRMIHPAIEPEVINNYTTLMYIFSMLFWLMLPTFVLLKLYAKKHVVKIASVVLGMSAVWQIIYMSFDFANMVMKMYEHRRYQTNATDFDFVVNTIKGIAIYLPYLIIVLISVNGFKKFIGKKTALTLVLILFFVSALQFGIEMFIGGLNDMPIGVLILRFFRDNNGIGFSTLLYLAAIMPLEVYTSQAESEKDREPIQRKG